MGSCMKGFPKTNENDPKILNKDNYEPDKIKWQVKRFDKECTKEFPNEVSPEFTTEMHKKIQEKYEEIWIFAQKREHLKEWLSMVD